MVPTWVKSKASLLKIAVMLPNTLLLDSMALVLSMIGKRYLHLLVIYCKAVWTLEAPLKLTNLLVVAPVAWGMDAG